MDEYLSTAEALMRAKQVRRVPVLDGEGRLLGILSLADIAKETARGTDPGYSHTTSRRRVPTSAGAPRSTASPEHLESSPGDAPELRAVA